MARARDTRAEYAARKARLAAEGTTLAKQRGQRARALGYTGLAEQRARRRAGDLAPLDAAARRTDRRVTNIGGDRWTWHGDPRRAADRASLDATLRRAHRADTEMRVSVTAEWRTPDGRTGTATAGTHGGVNADRLTDVDDIADELGAVGTSDLPAGATITSLSLFVFPVGEAA